MYPAQRFEIDIDATALNRVTKISRYCRCNTTMSTTGCTTPVSELTSCTATIVFAAASITSNLSRSISPFLSTGILSACGAASSTEMFDRTKTLALISRQDGVAPSVAPPLKITCAGRTPKAPQHQPAHLRQSCAPRTLRRREWRTHCPNLMGTTEAITSGRMGAFAL